MRKPLIDVGVFKERRAELAEKIPGAAVLLVAHPEHIRNHDVQHPYRQDSNFFYLTGLDEPESVFIFRPGKDPETVLFVRPKDVLRETWDGFRYGPEAAKEIFDVDAAYLISEFEEKAPELLVDVSQVFYRLFHDKKFDERFEVVLESIRRLKHRSGQGNLTIADSYPLVGEQRVHKRPEEIEFLRTACEISADAHIEAMKTAKAGMNERVLHGVLLQTMMAGGADREGYSSIVASGPNATTLHYIFNDRVCKDGDLVLIDAGAEYKYYTGDITRTFPVNGRFTDVQKRIYQKVLDVQKYLIGMVCPGVTKKEIQDESIDKLVDVMLDEKLLKGIKEDIIATQEYRKYYPHGFGHFLGSDVHDAGLAEVAGESRMLMADMCITIEPGLYIPHNDEAAPEELRGIGIRIEDDVLVTREGHEVLSAKAPKEIADIEKLMSL